MPVGSGSSRQREYVSDNTQLSDPGMAKPFAGEQDGVRDHGAGARNEGTGSGSEGDVDTDFIGAGGTGLAATGPGDDPGPDDSDGTSNQFASPLPAAARHGQAVVEPAQGRNQTSVGRVGGSKRVTGTTVAGDIDMQTGPPGQGADAATNPTARGDDSFAGEVSSGEAQGQDLSMGPSQETQGAMPGDNQVDGQKDFEQ